MSLHSRFFLLYLGYQLFLVKGVNLLPFLQVFIKSLEVLELCKDRSVQLIDAVEGSLSNRFLVIREEEPSKVFVEEEVPRVILWLAHGQLLEVLAYLIFLWRHVLQKKFLSCLGEWQERAH